MPEPIKYPPEIKSTTQDNSTIEESIPKYLAGKFGNDLRLLQDWREAGGEMPGPALAAEPKPAEYLWSWREILSALELPNEDADRGKVSRANKEFGGPIVIPKRGAQPKVEKGKLLEWWNGLEKSFARIAAHERDREATVSDQHDYGKSGTVVPDIAGSVKKRRT